MHQGAILAMDQGGARLPSSTVAAVANEFLALGREQPSMPAIDQMKLQKLLFYAHAWHLGYDHGPLFENDFEAWPWGPVVRDVYMQTRAYGRGPVTSNLWEFGRAADTFDVVTPAGVASPMKPFIRSVWDTLKAYTGIQLSNSTHAQGEPWTIISERLGTSSKPTIPNELIETVFKGKLGVV